MYSVIIDFQDRYGYAWLKSKYITQQEVVFEGTYDECYAFYLKKKEEQDNLEEEFNNLENQNYWRMNKEVD